MRTTGKCDLLRRWGDPALERGVAYVIPEPDHASDGGPAVLAKPVHSQKYSYLAHLSFLQFVYLPRVYVDGVPAGSRSYKNTPESLSKRRRGENA